MKIAQFLLTSTCLTLLPLASFSMEDTKDVNNQTSSNIPSTQNSTPQTPTPQKENLFGLKEEAAESLKKIGIPVSTNFVEISRVDAGHDDSTRPQWQKNFNPIAKFFTEVNNNLQSQHGIILKNVESFYTENKNPESRWEKESLKLPINFNDEQASGSKEILTFLDSFSDFLYDQSGNYLAFDEKSEERGILQRSIQANGRSMFMAFLSSVNVLEDLTNQLNILLDKQNDLSIAKRGESGKQGNLLKAAQKTTQEKQNKVMEQEKAILTLRQEITESLRAPNKATWSPSQTLDQELKGQSTYYWTTRGKKIENLYNPKISKEWVEKIYNLFTTHIVPVEFNENYTLNRNKAILELIFGKNLENIQNSMQSLVENRQKRTQKWEIEEKEQEQNSQKLLETKKLEEQNKLEEEKKNSPQSSSGIWSYLGWGSKPTTIELKIEEPKTEKKNENTISENPKIEEIISENIKSSLTPVKLDLPDIQNENRLTGENGAEYLNELIKYNKLNEFLQATQGRTKNLFSAMDSFNEKNASKNMEIDNQSEVDDAFKNLFEAQKIIEVAIEKQKQNNVTSVNLEEGKEDKDDDIKKNL